MSHDYRIHCRTCDEPGTTLMPSYMEEKLVAIARELAPALAAFAPTFRRLREIKGDSTVWLTLSFENDHLDPEWFERHAGHDVTVRDEYGVYVEDCGRHIRCACCERSTHCVLARRHDGACSPKREG